MKNARRSTFPLALATALVLVACAHAPLQVGTPAAHAREAPAAVVVTGSHIPQRVDLASGLPGTTSPLRVHTRQELDSTGEPSTADALRRLTP